MTPLTRVLCPVDFSDHARHVFEYAVALAAPRGAAVVALYVHHMSVPVPKSGYVGSLQPVALSAAARHELQQRLDELVAGARARGVAVDTRVAEALVVPRAIVETARLLPADAIVIGTHGQGGFNRSMLGTVANKVVHTTPCPVLLVPPPSEGEAFSWRRIVCPVDFSQTSALALEYATELAEDGAPVTVLHVVELPTEGDGDEQEASAYRRGRLERARTALDRILQAEERGRLVDGQLVAGKPALEIVRASIEAQADLLVLGTQGQGASDPASIGSTVQHVLRNTVCPVLAVPALEAPAAAAGAPVWRA